MGNKNGKNRNQNSGQIRNKQDKKSSRAITIIAAAAFVLLIFFFLLFSEAVTSGQIRIQNDTDMDISRISIFFDNANSELYAAALAEPYRSEDLIETAVAAGQAVTGKFNEVPLSQMDAELCVSIDVDGEPVEYYSGNFQEDYKGKITVRVYEEEGERFIRIWAETGIFIFSKTIFDIIYQL